MEAVVFLLTLYFSAILGIAGLTKLDDPRFFRSVLHHQQILPKWGINGVSKIFPWIEILLSVALLASPNLYKVAVAFLLLFLFLTFFIFNILLYRRKRSGANCGCFGKHVERKGLNTDIITSFIQLILAVLLVVLLFWAHPLSMGYYLVSSILNIVILSWLAWRTWQRHQRFTKENRLPSAMFSLRRSHSILQENLSMTAYSGFDNDTD